MSEEIVVYIVIKPTISAFEYARFVKKYMREFPETELLYLKTPRNYKFVTTTDSVESVVEYIEENTCLLDEYKVGVCKIIKQKIAKKDTYKYT